MNVSKGQVAKADDLMAAFGTESQKEVCLQVKIWGFAKFLESAFILLAFLMASSSLDSNCYACMPMVSNNILLGHSKMLNLLSAS